MRNLNFNRIAENFLTPQENDEIYRSLENAYSDFVMESYAQSIKDFWLSDSVKSKIIKYCEEVFGEFELELDAYQFARYNNKKTADGVPMQPNLPPHFDNFEDARYTFDLQLRSNTEWAIVVEDKEFLLTDNSALTFMGTHQIHWRPRKVFNDDQYIDMLFCHLSKKMDKSPLSDTFKNLMKQKQDQFLDSYNNNIPKPLVGFARYNEKLPVYLSNPLSNEDLNTLRDIVKTNRETYSGNHQYTPKIEREISRQTVDFKCPENIKNIIDGYIKPIYKDEIEMSHYNYIDYDLKYSADGSFPALPPHVDAAETPMTFNLMIGGNIDWDLYLDGERHTLKVGDALVFSSLNQVHWRPKRYWKPGEYVEIVSFNYSPLDNWRFTGEPDPIDPRFFMLQRQRHVDILNQRQEMINAWKIYNEDGLRIGIPTDKHGGIA